ncbi:MAG: VIT family protein [bacterium ADurb.Bin400]|nr:MAG: VIT family protein [bacterium ADurb.Bin400]
MNHSSKVGFSFGTTSGIITTLGLITGLTASDASKAIIMGGVLTIAFADAFSDALGIHISEESENEHTNKEVWASTISTYFSKLLIALTFLVPLILFSSATALVVSIIWGAILLTLLNYTIYPKNNRWQAVTEHLFIGMIVIVIGFVIGQYIRNAFQ